MSAGAMPGRALPVVRHLRLEGSPLQAEAADLITQLYDALCGLVAVQDSDMKGTRTLETALSALAQARGDLVDPYALGGGK